MSDFFLSSKNLSSKILFHSFDHIWLWLCQHSRHKHSRRYTLNYFNICIENSNVCGWVTASAVCSLDEEEIRPLAAKVKGHERIHTGRSCPRWNINPCHLFWEHLIICSSCRQLMDSQAEDFLSWAERWGFPPGLKRCWWSLTWRQTLSLPLPEGVWGEGAACWCH